MRIEPLFPTAAKVPFPYAMLFRCAVFPVYVEDHVAPLSDEIRVVP